MNKISSLLLLFSLVCSISCSSEQDVTLSGLKISDFETELEGKPIRLYVLKNRKGLEACVTNYGARVVSLMVPDRDGKLEDIVCGFPTIAQYLERSQNFGATIGRYIGRIGWSTFSIDSITYHLKANTDLHCSHGGTPGFASRVWSVEEVKENSLTLRYVSPDGENGFPGELDVALTYRLTDENELDIQYSATTDKPTVVNLSHHSFFNISGDLNTTVEDQFLYINADSYTPLDSTKMVTGEIVSVKDTPFDFLAEHQIGERIDDSRLAIAKGYDHNWVLNTNGDDRKMAAKLRDKKSGRVMEVYTNEPGLQIYTANGLKGKMVGKKEIAYPFRNSICLETQHFPNSPNIPHFPSTVLRPGETYHSHCVYRFRTIARTQDRASFRRSFEPER